MKFSFAGIGAIALAATPLCAIPLALPSTAAQAKAERVTERSPATDRAAYGLTKDEVLR